MYGLSLGDADSTSYATADAGAYSSYADAYSHAWHLHLLPVSVHLPVGRAVRALLVSSRLSLLLQNFLLDLLG